jgi:glycosyltransferase involved in cell wall biosynthesis
VSDPVVTVVTATYNRKKSLDLTLQSLLQQDLTDFEAWIVGDACTDGSEQVVASFRDSRLHWVNLADNSGSQSVPNNEGLRRARGRYIAYLPHDDVWLPWHLTTAIDALEAQQADWIHTFCAMVGPEGAAWAVGAPPPGTTYRTHSIPPVAWLHRRGVVENVGGWKLPTTLPRPADLDILHRLSSSGARLAFCPELTVLKFPSWEYQAIYQARGDPPHASYLRRLVRDPRQLQIDLYRDIALSLARFHATADIPPRVATGQLVASVGTRMCRLWGEERWPVPMYRRWAYRRRYTRTRKHRGL